MNTSTRPSHRLVLHLARGLAACAGIVAPSLGQRLLPEVVDQRLDAWETAQGVSWSASIDARTGYAELLYGNAVAPSAAPASDADWRALALAQAASTRPMHGIDAAHLVPRRVVFLPLGQADSTDKMSVELHQVVDGIPVVGGSMSLLFDTRGGLLAVQSTATPELGAPALAPRISSGEARSTASAEFAARHFVGGTERGEARLALLPMETRNGVEARLAWQVEYAFEGDGAPLARRYWIDAQDGRVLRDDNQVHNFDLRGTVSAFVSPGTFPDVPVNVERVRALPYARLQALGSSYDADRFGRFVIPGVTTPTSVTARYSGPYAHVLNADGSEYSSTFTLFPDQDSRVTLGLPLDEATVAQSNAFLHINKMREWIRSVIATDATADFQALANTNVNANCNATYSGNAVNFYDSSGQCVNSSYSSVIAHEMGHWLNVRYGTNNGSDGMGEGNADVFAMYLADTHVIGQHFFQNGDSLRTGLNTRQFCGDSNPGCYGQVHNDGEVWMGAAWKIRRNLKARHGASNGALIADTLFLSWMNAFNQTQIRSVMELQWLVLDDDDGNVSNGTPNAFDIDSAFREQGFPGYGIDFVPNDDCADAEPIGGTGVFPFDNRLATEDGADHALCQNAGEAGIERDVWFLWTAPTDGDYAFSTCSQTNIDSKLAVYPGACSSGAPIACLDDTCGLQQTLTLRDLIGGVSYRIRLGVYPGAAGGTGYLRIEDVSTSRIYNYCSANPNTSGRIATIGSNGKNSVDENRFRLHALGLPPSVQALLFMGSDQTQVTFGAGYNCLGGQVYLLGITGGGPAGTPARRIDMESGSNAAGLITPGSTWNFQWWYRDVPLGGPVTNTTDGLSVIFRP